MRILMLSWEYPPKSIGGLAQHVYDLSHAMQDLGHEITVITAGDEKLLEYEEDGSIKIYRVKPFPVSGKDFLTWVFQLNFAMLEKTFEILRDKGEFDIVHAHDWLVAFAARALKHGAKLPLVATIHATECGRNQGLHNSIQRYISDVEWWLMYEAWKVIVCSNFMQNEIRNVFQVPEDKIHVIPNGVNPESFVSYSESFRRQDYVGDNEKIVFFVGRMVPEKGVQIILDAIPKIIYHYPNVKFIISGKGQSLDYLKTKSAILGVGAKCYFTGYIDEKLRNAFYNCAAAAVFPSTYEPFGIVALEAMAAHVPVVVSDVGGLGEIVNHGIDGLKAIPGNVDSFADNILAILKDDKFASFLKENAFRRVEREFSWEKIALQTVDIYKQVLQHAKSFVSNKKISKRLSLTFLNQKSGR